MAIRVLLVNRFGADLDRGGTERYVADLGLGLRSRGHQVSVLSTFAVGDAAAASLDTVVVHREAPDAPLRRGRNHLDDWLAAPRPRLGRVLSELSPDLVHTNNLPGLSTSIWEQARRLGVPVVHTLHDYHLLCPHTSLTRGDGSPCRPSPMVCGLRTRRLARWAGAVSIVIGVSEHVLERHRHVFGERTVKRVIRAPLPRMPAAIRPPAERPRTLGYLGSLTAVKGVDTLLAAAEPLTALGISTRIAGDGPLRASVSPHPFVEYVGRVPADRIDDFLGSCDLGVVPSRWEEPGVTYVLMQWLAAGRPVLSSGRGGLAEAAGLGGVVSFGGSTSDLVESVRGLRDEGRWSEAVTGTAAADGVLDPDAWLEQHLAAYAEATT